MRNPLNIATTAPRTKTPTVRRMTSEGKLKTQAGGSRPSRHPKLLAWVDEVAALYEPARLSGAMARLRSKASLQCSQKRRRDRQRKCVGLDGGGEGLFSGPLLPPPALRKPFSAPRATAEILSVCGPVHRSRRDPPRRSLFAFFLRSSGLARFSTRARWLRETMA